MRSSSPPFHTYLSAYYVLHPLEIRQSGQGGRHSSCSEGNEKKKIEQIWSFNENCCKYLKLQGVVKMCKQWGNPHWELQGGLGEGVFELSAEG